MTQFMTLLEIGRTNNYYRSVGSQGHLMINEVRICQQVINHVVTSIAKHVHEFVKLPSPEEENLIA